MGTGLTAIPNERTSAEITLMVDTSNYDHITTAKTAKEAWGDALMNVYEDTGLTRKRMQQVTNAVGRH